jgi:competence protein ComEC
VIKPAQKLSFCRPSLLFAFGLGVAGLQVCPQIPYPLLSLFLLFLCIFVIHRWSKLAVLFATFLGFAYCSLWANVYLSNRMTLDKSGITGYATVQVIDLPKYDVDQWQFQGRIIQSDDFPELVSQKIKLSWYRTKQHISSGDIWKLQLKLSIPNGVQNPGGFDSEQRALQQNWVAQGYVKNQTEYLGYRYTIDRFRSYLSKQIEIALPNEKARFIQALALGDTRAISDQDWEILRRTGITHLIAISGFHVGIVALFAVYCSRVLYKLFPRIGLAIPWPVACAWVSILSSSMYTAMAGFAIPTVRTSLMIAFFMLAKILYRNISTIHAVAMSMVFILLWDPFAILSAGFWLSFSGVLLLIGFMPNTNYVDRLMGFIRAQWVVSLGLLPLCIGFFSQTTVIGPFVNMIAIPWISLIVVPLALLGVLFSWVPVVASFFWQCAYQCMQWFWMILEYLQQVQWASISIAEPSLLITALAVLGVCLCLLPKPYPGKYLGIFLLFPLLFQAPEKIPYNSIRIAVVDVGQGLSVLVRTKNHQLLYDTGAGNANGFSRGTSTLAPALNALQIKYLDKVIISHGDNDHYGGLDGLKKSIKIGQIEASSESLQEQFKECKQGDSWVWDGVRFSYLWPDHEISSKKNDRSCVLRIEADGKSVLLTGDISKNSEYPLIEKYGKKIQSDILVVPHHGSKTSSSIEFLNVVKPKIAIVSNGFQNRFKHPNSKVVERYQYIGANIVNTADMGWIELQSLPSGWQWKHRERIDKKKFWHRPSHLASSTEVEHR